MRWLKYLIVAPITFTALTPLHAQEVLDRVEPTRLEQNKVDQVANDRPASAKMAPAVATPVLVQRELTVGAIEIVGLQVLTNSDFVDIVQDHIGRSLKSNEIVALVDRLASRAQRRFPLASARIAPQDVAANILKVEIEEGRVDSVELSGFSNRRVKQALQRLADGAPVTSVALERAVLLARDMDGITINETTVKRVGDRNILVVKGAYDRFRGQVAIDNDTTRPIGPFELFGFMQSNGVFSHDDSLQAYFLASLPEPEELAFLRLRYAKRIDDAGTELSVAASYSRSNPGSYLAPLDIEGEGAWAGIALSRPLERSVRSSLWVEASLSFRELRQESAEVISRLDRLTVARLRLSGSASFAGGVVRSNVTLAQGVNTLGATQLGDPLSSRPDAGQAFTTLQLEGRWSAPIVGALKIAMGVRTQLASDPLFVSEEIGLGGARFARGYDYSERTGDQGTQGYVELAYKIDAKLGPLNGLTPYVFLDGGLVTNLANGRGGGSLASVGGGVRLDVDRRTDASIEFAVPLSGPRYDTDTQRARTRVSVTRYF